MLHELFLTHCTNITSIMNPFASLYIVFLSVFVRRIVLVFVILFHFPHPIGNCMAPRSYLIQQLIVHHIIVDFFLFELLQEWPERKFLPGVWKLKYSLTILV